MSRRLFSSDIVCSDAFRALPAGSQALYFQICMEADDDGIVDNIASIMRIMGCRKSALQALLDSRFLLEIRTKSVSSSYEVCTKSVSSPYEVCTKSVSSPYEVCTTVIIIKHWFIHNTIRKDRHKSTNYVEALSQVCIKPNKAYSLKTEKPQLDGLDKNDAKFNLATNGQTDGEQDDNQPSEPSVNEAESIDASLGNQAATESPPKLSKVKLSKDNKHIVEQARQVIDYLNAKTGKNFKPDAASHLKHIRARLNENYTVEDFKKVIDIKVAEWGGGDMAQYLKPSTLFAVGHFDDYLNQKPSPKKGATNASFERFSSAF